MKKHETGRTGGERGALTDRKELEGAVAGVLRRGGVGGAMVFFGG